MEVDDSSLLNSSVPIIKKSIEQEALNEEQKSVPIEKKDGVNNPSETQSKLPEDPKNKLK